MTAKRAHVVAVRLSDEEYGHWQQRATEDGRRQVGRWVRETVQRSLTVSGGHRAAARPIDPAIRALKQELARVGNNLNQAMRYANTAPHDPAGLEQLRGQVANCSQQIKAMRSYLDQVAEDGNGR